MSYNHQDIEKKWQDYWEKNQTFKSDLNSKKKKYYVLDMFPYPSGAGLHIGHLLGYTGSDVFARYKKMQGYEVLHPIGWDAFGLPAEQYAIKTNNSPKLFTKKNIKNFKKQIKSAGFSYDFSKEINTTHPNYYKITQWIFSKMYEKGLAEIQKQEVNWCEKLGTVLSNEEIIIKDNVMVSERGNYPVTKKEMAQWVLKITKYADKLLSGLDELEWPDSIKSLQRNWIGKEEGWDISFNLDEKTSLDVFINKKDITNDIAYILISPKNPIIQKLITSSNKKMFDQYYELSERMSDIQKENDITGLNTNRVVVNPLTNKEIPVWVSNNVSQSFGTMSRVGFLNRSEWDKRFIERNKIKIDNKGNDENKANLQDVIKTLTEEKWAVEKTYYRLRDWLFSRQRYWGEPFPIIHLSNGDTILEKNLPLELPPLDDFKPSSDGIQPLGKLNEWVNVSVKGKKGKRETNTMPQWAGSCWFYIAYLLRESNDYIDIESKKAITILDKWLPVDLYIGGQEHAVLHLLYARFWHHFLYDLGITKHKEPFKKLVNQGMILGENGIKMSKSLGNVINPDSLIKRYGVDAIRIAELFLGAFEDNKSWSNATLEAIYKWLNKIYRSIVLDQKSIIDFNDLKLESTYHDFIMKITKNIDRLKYNLVISDMMVFFSELSKREKLHRTYLLNFVKVLSLFAPHIGEEIWNYLDEEQSIYSQKWPTFNEKKILQREITIIIQINGKVRGTIKTSEIMNESEIISKIKDIENIKIYLDKGEILKIINIKNKLFNIVMK